MIIKNAPVDADKVNVFLFQIQNEKVRILTRKIGLPYFIHIDTHMSHKSCI